MTRLGRVVVGCLALVAAGTAVGIAASGLLGPTATNAGGQPTPVPSATASTVTSPSAAPVVTPPPTQWDLALADARSLSLAEAAGQVIMPDISSNTPADAADLVRSRHLAGLIVMGGTVSSEKGVKALTTAIAGADPDRDWPIMISTDQEGGTVQRLQPVLGYVSAFMAAGANGDEVQIHDYYDGLGSQMAALGFTMDMGPDADVTIGLKDPVIRTRSAGSQPDAVAGVVTAAWQGLQAGGVTPVLKHFPGHGSVTVDSHHALPVQGKSVADLEGSDLIPFSSAITAGAPAVMVGHIEVTEWGAAPASVNPRAYAYLREHLGFTGLTMTDAMNMGAITDSYSAGKAAALAVAAGADLVLMPANVDKAIAGIVAAVEDGSLSRERLDEAAAHVILAARQQGGSTVGDLGDRPADFVEGSIVVAAKDCSALVGTTATIRGGNADQRNVLAKALEKKGVAVGDSGTSIQLVFGDRGHGNADVVVATGGTWGLPKSTASTYVAIWGAGGAQLRALADILTGAAEPQGTWPVSLKLPYRACS